MITEIVIFSIPEEMSREEVITGFEANAPNWKANPDLIHKSYLVDIETRTAGGVYLWHTRADGERWHGEEFRQRILSKFGNEPRSQFFETPIVVDNVADEIVKA